MQGSTKIPITILNVHITCKICNGYFVDATTVIECLHTFCRSCIVKYLEKNKYCPVCDVQIHKTKPLLNIRPDKTLQDLVYKLVPRLFQNEMQKRRAFYDSHPESKPSSLEQCGEATYQHLLTPEETICLTLTYHGCGDKPRYLRCPAAVSMAHLKKLICAKYDLSDNHRVDILYNQDCLNSSLTLMDVAYIYLWKRKEPIELTYRIYERTSKRPKLELECVETTQMNNNNWKEVQLRISENGEMSITGIQDDTLSPSLLEIVNSEPKYKNDVNTEDSKSPNKIVGKKELPALKYIGKGNSSTVCTMVSTSSTSVPNIPTTTKESKLKIDYKSITLVPPNPTIAFSSYGSTMSDTKPVNISISTPLSVCATLSSATTTTVYSTINSSKCSTKSEEVITAALPLEMSFKQDDLEEKTKPSSPPTVKDGTCDKSLKRKNVAVADTEPPSKHPKQSILNHSLGLQNLSNNHPLKKHSKLNRNGENVKDLTSTIAIPSEIELVSVATTSCTTTSTTRSINVITTSEPTTSKTNSVNKNFLFVQSQSNTSLTTPKSPGLSIKPLAASVKPPVTCYGAVKPPCYMPKSSYNPVINVPKPVTSTTSLNHSNKVESRPAQEVSASSSLSPVKTDSAKLITTSCSHSPQQINVQNSNSKLSIKTKPSIPIGYKTLRDPPQSWNSQISKANLTKSSPEPKYSDLKNIRPAKFFKMRNNMPRYLGNPASGVKPMYQLHVSPDKEKNKESIKTEKSEIKKHSIVKIDPKTLRPISEKAPETTSLSNHSSSNQCLSNHNFINQNYSSPSLGSPLNNLSMQNDLKINTSSVSIFSPLKLQSSPKNERKSPKSPHSPKPKTTSSPTGSKREKMNLNFTPSNPFIPNLSSTTLSPNQFLYPTGPPGFPPYDHRMMAAYHHLWYGQRMPFPTAPMPGLSLDLNQQRKNLEMLSSPTSPKMGALSQLNHQISSRPATTTSNISSISRTHNLLPSPNTYKPPTSSKKNSKDSKSEKSLENAVEKLTQNRHKAIGSKGGLSISSSGPKNSGVEQKEKRASKQRDKCAKDPVNTVQEKNSSGKAIKVKSEPLSPAGCSVLVPSEISLPPTHLSKSDFGSNTCYDKSGTNPSEKGLSNSSSDNTKSSVKQDSSKVINNDKTSLTISKTTDVPKPEEKKSDISVLSKKSHETSGLGRALQENKSEIKVEVSEVLSSAVFTKTDVDCAVQDISVSVNTTPCTVKVEEGVTGSNFAKVIKNNDSNHRSEDIILKGNGLC